ncbi:ribbon-helix-helix domain-containing protein [Salinirubellus sp. GCM10025818]|uniref:ribbon-helix-helix domain-containing protein n=1 Tax=Salinirubellus TaxID=2162630 RepID=UPI0030D4B5AD
MTFEEEDPRPQLNVRLDEELMEQLDTLSDSTGVTKTEVVRAAVKERLPERMSEDHSVPSDENLRETYLWLLENSRPDGTIEAALAKNELAQFHGKSEELVKKTRLRPLQRRGWTSVRNATIKVHEETGRPQRGESE